MATVAEILAQMLDTSSPETEKNASRATDTEVDEIRKLASEFGCTPEEVAKVAAEVEEEEKQAEAVKQAEEAVYVGRFIARGFIDELQKLGAGVNPVGGSEPTTDAEGGNVPQDGSVANRIADALSKTHGQKQTPKKDELKAAIKARRANFQVGSTGAIEPKPALMTESK